MLENGPGVQEAIAAYRTSLARASVDTPLPNPSLEVGPEFGFGSDVMTRRIAPFGALGIVIPLGGRLGRTDDLHRIRAEVARIDGVARHRELYLQLRRSYAALFIARQRREVRREILGAATVSVVSVRRLVDAGQGTAIDVALFQLEKGRAEAKLIDTEVEETDAAAKLASLVGVHPSLFASLPEDPLPDPLAELPTLEMVKAGLVVHHPELGRLRARYEESEAALRLEVAKQYPDFHIGPSIGGETGENKTTIGLTLGIDLPIFDRNQQAIAEADGRREESRVRYEAAARRALVEIERAHRNLALAVRGLRLLQGTVLPEARSSVDLARRSLEAGSGDALRFIDAERSYREILIQVLDAELATHDAWRELELATGKPLVLFPSEEFRSAGKAPEALESQTSDDAPPRESDTAQEDDS
jgi:outer membrane protein TolC